MNTHKPQTGYRGHYKLPKHELAHLKGVEQEKCTIQLTFYVHEKSNKFDFIRLVLHLHTNAREAIQSAILIWRCFG